jgi:hypothetical protein
MKKSWIGAVTGATLAVGVALPASAGAAPVISGLAPCYTAVPPHGVPAIPIALSGGTPGDTFQVDISNPKAGEGSLGDAQGSFDAHGNGTTTLTDTYPPNGSIDPSPGQRANLSVLDFTPNGTVDTPAGSVLITNLALNLGFVGFGGNRASTLTVSGTPFAHKKLYAFVVHNRRIVRRFYVGRANVCGYAKRRVTLVPRHTPRGRYQLYVNAGPKLNRRESLSQKYRVELF